MEIFSVMNSLMKKHIGFVVLSLLTGFFTIATSIGMLSSSAVLISKAALHPEVLELMVLIVAVRFFSISRGVCRYLERLFSHNATFRLLSTLRRWFYKHFNESYSENNKEFRSGDIYTKLVNDVDSLKEFYLRGVYPFVTAILIGILTFIILSFYSLYLAFVFLFFFLLTGFVLPVILFRLNNSLFEKERDIRKDMNVLLIDMQKGISEIYIYATKASFNEKYISLSKEFSLLQKRKNLVMLLGDHLHGFMVSLLLFFSLLQCAPLVAIGKLPGIFYAMIPLTIMASFEALLPMPNILYRFNEAANAGKSISDVTHGGTIEIPYMGEKVTSTSLHVKNLSVREEGTESYMIQDISFELPLGKRLAIVGMSGAGKSTILKVLMRFIQVSGGDICLGDKSYTNLDIEEIRKNFTYVEQTPYFFNATIKENLLIADPYAEDEKLAMAIDKAQLTDVIKGLPHGIYTPLGQYGIKISGGEKQRLAIARALLKDSAILLLDEPTASLDVAFESKLIYALHEILKGKSCIWVTHRLIGMEKMDEILYMHKGKVIERGTHHQLLDKRGAYYKMWSIQQSIIE